MRQSLTAILLFALCAAGAAPPATSTSSPAIPASPPPAAEFRNGRWQPIAPATTQPQADAVLDHVESLLKSGQNNLALKLDLYWIKSHTKQAPLRDRAVFLMGQANFQLDDRVKAFYYFDEVMDEYPESSLFNPSLAMQFKIADDFLAGHKRRFLGLPLISMEEEAIEMLYRIQQRSPGSPLAETALLRTADYYYANSDYDLAHDAYGTYIKNYPRSVKIPQVMLRQAFSSLAQFHGVKFDPTTILDGKAELKDFATAYPEMAADENVAAVISAVDQTLAAKLYVIGDFYRRTHVPEAAVYTYRYLILKYPDYPEANQAKKALTKMPKWALEQPLPVITPDKPSAGS